MSLAQRLDELVTLFNTQKTDLPQGAIHKDCVFRLNGRAYHEQLGRAPDDPLVRLIGCGPAAYRLLLTAVRYAMVEPRVTLRAPASTEQPDATAVMLSTRAMLSGRLRGTEAPLRAECEVALRGDADGQILELAVTMGDADIELILAARHR